jgi:hypothetical protein
MFLLRAMKVWRDVSQQRGRAMRLELAVRGEQATQWWARILWSALWSSLDAYLLPRSVVRCVESCGGGTAKLQPRTTHTCSGCPSHHS